MSRYRNNTEANRDALFGPNPGGSKKKSSAKKTSSAPATNSFAVPSITPGGTNPTNFKSGSTGPRRTNNVISALSGEAKLEKMKEAEGYRKKAKTAMTKGVFSSADPIAGAMWYHRAAEAYKLCGENRLERLHRIASGDCQMGHGAYASAASDYIRAAELSEMSDEVDGRKRAECTKLYKDAAQAWREQGEKGRAAECMLKSAFSLLIGREGDDADVIGGRRLTSMDQEALKAIEASVESHVPDPMNRYLHLRQTGISAFLDPENEEGGKVSSEFEMNEDMLEMCRNHIVTASFSHETLSLAVKKLVEYGEHQSALYAAGAVSATLEYGGFATISLARSYCVETVLALAMGDVVTADKFFLQSHLQNSSYLTTRECKLSEDLIRAIKMRDVDDLESARDPNGENRAAMANLDFSVRSLIAGLKISGAVRKMKSPTPLPVAAPVATAAAEVVPDANAVPSSKGGNNLQNELDDLMNDMGLDGDDDDDDDDFDLR